VHGGHLRRDPRRLGIGRLGRPAPHRYSGPRAPGAGGSQRSESL